MKTKTESTKVKKVATAKPVMQAEYDFTSGERGKYARQYAQGAKVVVLDADVARVFKDSAAVNAALRALLPKRSPARTPARSLVVREKPTRYKPSR